MGPHAAVLVLDTPIEGLASEFGDRGDNILDLLGGAPVPLAKYQIAYSLPGIEDDVAIMEQTFARLAAEIDAGTVRAVVLTGSRSDSFATDIPWLTWLDKFIQDVLFVRERFPIVGICFGHQVLAKNLGCRVGRNPAKSGWEAGIHTVALNKSILDIECSPFRTALRIDGGKILEHINLLQFHRDLVYCNPPAKSKHLLLAATTFQNVGSTPKCSIQGLVTESGPVKILTFQGHPEIVGEQGLVMLRMLLDMGLIDKSTFERLTYNTKNLENQGMLVGRIISDFIATYFES